MAKLTQGDAENIRSRYARGGTSMMCLAKEFGVSRMAVFKVIHCETWRRVDAETKALKARRRQSVVETVAERHKEVAN